MIFKNILVCVTQQKTCERLISFASKQRTQNSDFFVLHVAKNNWKFLDNTKEGEALEYLFSISKSYNADMTVLRSDDVIEKICQFTLQHGVGTIVLGESNESNDTNTFFENIKIKLQKYNITVICIPSDRNSIAV